MPDARRIAVSEARAGQREDPDVLYANRESAESVRAAIAAWRARLAADAGDVESGWKLARAFYWLGTNGPDSRDERKLLLRTGMDAARKVIATAPRRPEGHFWLAANMGALAESYGLVEGIRYRGAIREALEKVLETDAGYLEGSADRALGRWYYKVPRLFGGNRRKSAEHLEKALAYNPNSIITRLFLAETLMDLDRTDDARQHLAVALNAPLDPEWAPEDRRFREQARALLESLR
jgi:tetratricopeptide (TPR) repeat protein